MPVAVRGWDADESKDKRHQLLPRSNAVGRQTNCEQSPIDAHAVVSETACGVFQQTRLKSSGN